MKKSLILSILFLCSALISAQELSVGTDVVSRYVWRGTDFGQAPAIQPTLAFSVGGFEVGAWGSYQTTRSSALAGADELDLYLGYSFDLGESGGLSLLVTDYYFPNGGIKFFNFNSYDDADPGAHTIEGGISYSGPESFPISVSLYSNLYSGADSENTMYFEVGYSTAVKDVALDIFVGGTPGGDSGYYGTTELNLINMGLTASKEIKITDDFSLPVFGSYIINPYTETSFFVFGLSL